MKKRIVVIGAGPGGYVAAIRAAQLGGDVTLVEKENVGGTCLNWGCIPTKVLVTTAELLEKFGRASEFGIAAVGQVRADLERLMARKAAIVQSQRDGIRKLIQHNRIRYINGRAVIRGPGLAEVGRPGEPPLELAWDRLILATGTRPLEIPAFPFDGKRILSSDHALSLSDIPDSMIIVGGGVIGSEFASIFSALGSRVAVVEALSRMLPLPSVDESCSKTLEREMKKRKIAFHVNRVVESVEETKSGVRASIGPSPFLEAPSLKDQKTFTVEAEKVLVCVGRRPDTGDLGLGTLGLETDPKGWIIVDERMETSVPGVYAVGDILGPSKIMLAHVASTEGNVAAENAMGQNRSMDYTVVPGAVFSSPEIADVGLTETQAGAAGLNARSDTVLFRALGKAQAMGEIAGQAKIVSDAESGKILGVHIVGAHATDLIGEAALAMKMEASVQDLAETIHAHPTLPEIMLEASFKALGRSLHG
jgi:dihydrolipoamide dehydrogenase